MATFFRDAFYKLAPSWLTSEEGELVLYSLDLALDGMWERIRQGLLARFPEYAPADAFRYMSRDRKILRGIDETTENFATRLLRWLDDHRTRGNPYALMEQLRAYCNADVRIRTVDNSGNWYTLERDGSREYLLAEGNWDWDGEASKWSRFWVIIYPTATGEPWTIQGNWGDAGLYDIGEFGQPGQTVGTSATPGQVGDIRRIIADWKPAGTNCVWIIIAFDDASFDPTTPAQPTPGPGTWGNWGKYSVGSYTASRLATARYWKGVDGSVAP